MSFVKMFKSIFTRLLTTYLLIIISAVLLLSVLMTFFYSNLEFDKIHKNQLNAAKRINVLANDYIAGYLNKSQLVSNLNSIGYVSESGIYIVRADFRYLSGQKTLDIDKELMEVQLIDDIKIILKNKTVYYKSKYLKSYETYVVFTGVPLKDNGKVTGAILLFTPLDSITEYIGSLIWTIWLIALFAILISSIFIYITSRNISQPIKKMESAALKLAKGEEHADIEITSRDEIGKLSESFNYMKNQLAITEKMRREFITNVSHELRTPLTSIRGFIQGMLDGLIKAENMNKFLNIIMDEVMRLTRLTGEILELAKLQSGNIRLLKEKVHLTGLANDISESVKPLLEEKNQTFNVVCDESYYIIADPDRLKQILFNITGNAIKYTGKNGSIRLDISKKDSDFLFSVSDNGIGIPPDELPYIFEKFYMVDKSRGSSGQSSGVGLNIAKSLVEMHGGRIEAKSTPGEGTEIIFCIPDIL